jgi:acyl-CoA thioester hydrolase
MRKPGEAEPFVTAHTVNVMVDGQTWKKKPIPDFFRVRLERGAPGLVVDHAGHLAASLPESRERGRH